MHTTNQEALRATVLDLEAKIAAVSDELFDINQRLPRINLAAETGALEYQKKRTQLTARREDLSTRLTQLQGAHKETRYLAQEALLKDRADSFSADWDKIKAMLDKHNGLAKQIDDLIDQLAEVWSELQSTGGEARVLAAKYLVHKNYSAIPDSNFGFRFANRVARKGLPVQDGYSGDAHTLLYSSEQFTRGMKELEPTLRNELEAA